MSDHSASSDVVTARQTGRDASLMDILHKEVSLDSIWELLTYEIHVRKNTLKTQKLQNLLVNKGWVSREQIATYEKLLKRKGAGSLGDLLLDEGIIDDRQLGEINAQMAGVVLEDIDHAPIELDDIVLMDPELMTQAEAVLVCRQDDRLKVAFKDLATLPLLNDVRVYTGYPIEPVVAPRTQIRKRIAHVRELAQTDAYGRAKSLFETRRDIETTHETEAVVRLLDSILAEAFAVHATDIHFESKDDGLRVRYRMDGELHTALEIDQSIAPFVMRRIKVVAGLDISERRRPQVGRITRRVDGRYRAMRVSTVSTIFGEKLVMRLVHTDTAGCDIGFLRLMPEHERQLRECIEQPYGLVLACGPVGNGKTTTIYCAVNTINNPACNVMTIEDPVEFPLENTNQIEVNNETGVGFAEGLKSILRQDPNVVVVGEIRDAQSAHIAIQAGLSGVLVFSTVHASSAIGAVDTLLNLGVPRYMVGSCLKGIIAQRLVRRVCDNCRVSYTPDPRLTDRLRRAAGHDLGITEFVHGTGCHLCRESGFSGRLGVFEVCSVDEALGDAIARGLSKDELRRAALDHGMIPLVHSCVHRVGTGETTVEEVLRLGIA